MAHRCSSGHVMGPTFVLRAPGSCHRAVDKKSCGAALLSCGGCGATYLSETGCPPLILCPTCRNSDSIVHLPKLPPQLNFLLA